MSDAPLNRSEAFVLGVCQQSFLSLWCYNNPRSKPGKELCDILVICDPDVIVIGEIRDVESLTTAIAAAAVANASTTQHLSRKHRGSGNVGAPRSG